jgi:hypothetical protein
VSVVAEDTVQAGLLMEAAQAQQQLAESALERLREHAAGLDGVVRGEIRDALLEELHALIDDVRQAQAALHALQRAASARLACWSMAITSLACAVPLILTYRVLPNAADVAALGAQRTALEMRLAQLARAGADLELRRCGAAERLCVRIDRSAGAYGDSHDFLIVRGH